MGKSYTPNIFAKKLAAANVFVRQPAPVSGFGLPYCATPSSHNLFEARGAGLFVPLATGAVSDKPVDASADQNIIAAQDAMACIDATVRTLLVSARARCTHKSLLNCRVFCYLLLSVTLTGPLPFLSGRKIGARCRRP